MPPENYHCHNRVIKMKFIAILFLLCTIVGFAAASTGTTTTTEALSSTSTTASSAPSPVPCGNGPQGPCGKKLYFFY
ncbi:uncharacterized protein LOC122620449 [Drosophila teissieri]|uniref:uncharacterized protein LOC122620449 n=1 Tax=Drosophila teissieri TaxID=7243 RepID=UPI001CBA0162|nr:uncharacterized protein LOC122620449 [Drosophila teissieri]